MRLKFEPFDRERRFMESLNLTLLQESLWPLLAVFVLLSFSDTITTLFASVNSPGFVELNRLGSALFAQGFSGFMVAYLLKFVPIAPLFYMVAVPKGRPEYDFEVRLLKFAALVVLVFGDFYLGVIVLGNNVPQLLGYHGF